MKPGEPGYVVALWRSELKRAETEFEAWAKEAGKVVERYALDDEKFRKGTRFNVLWSNVKTLAPALYAQPPKMIAQRRYLDKDPIGRIACRIIQRAVQYQVDTGELHDATKMAVMDRLLGGRGQVWCRYEPTFSEEISDDAERDGTAEDGEAEEGEDRAGGDGGAPGAGDSGDAPGGENDTIIREVVHVDYVHWQDFRHDPARTWDEVGWVARRAFMTRDELVERFGDAGETVTLNCGPNGDKDDGPNKVTADELRKAEVWEIWNKAKAEVIWIGPATAVDGDDEPLDTRPDPYKLEGFFPCPKPLYATITSDSLVPTPDYLQYKAQAEQMDTIADRMRRLIEACQVRGVYDNSFPTLARVLRADEVDLIPVEAWAQFAAGGGMKGAIDFLPIDVFAKVLTELQTAKGEVKNDIYETTGISDILRGQGDPDETATGVQTKGHFATLRLKAEQGEVARFVRDVVRLMAELTCELFQPDVLAEMASCQEMDELQIPAPMPPPMPMGGPGLLGMGAGGPPPGMPPQGAPMMPQKLPMMAGAAPGIGA